MSKLTLYSYWRSSCSYRVRIALNLKGLEYGYEGVHLVRDGGEQYQDAYRSLNPMSQVPTLVVDGRPLTESMAICHWLDATYPEPALLPSDPWDRAQVMRFCEIINAGTQPIQNSGVLARLKQQYGADMEALTDWVRHWVAKGLASCEEMARQHAGLYCFGDNPGIADVFLVPQVYNAERWGVDMDQLPTLKRINAHCLEQAAFQKAMPDQQPDAPKDPA